MQGKGIIDGGGVMEKGILLGELGSLLSEVAPCVQVPIKAGVVMHKPSKVKPGFLIAIKTDELKAKAGQLRELVFKLVGDIEDVIRRGIDFLRQKIGDLSEQLYFVLVEGKNHFLAEAI